MFVQSWPAAGFSTNSPHNITGPITSGGSLLVAAIVVRNSAIGDIYVSDSGGNLWREASRVAAGSVTGAIFYANDTEPMDRVTLTIPSGGGARSLLLIEAWGGDLLDADGWDGTDSSPTVGQPVDVQAGGLVVAAGMAGVSDRTWNAVEPGASFPAVGRGSQTSVMAQGMLPRSAGTFSPTWTLESGNPAGLAVVAASFRPSRLPNPHALAEIYQLAHDGAWVPSTVIRL